MTLADFREKTKELDGNLVVCIYDNEGSVDELENLSTEYEFDGINAEASGTEYSKYISNAEERRKNRRKALILSQFHIPEGEKFL